MRTYYGEEGHLDISRDFWSTRGTSDTPAYHTLGIFHDTGPYATIHQPTTQTLAKPLSIFLYKSFYFPFSRITSWLIIRLIEWLNRLTG
jgi:hypothetical protein